MLTWCLAQKSTLRVDFSAFFGVFHSSVFPQLLGVLESCQGGLLPGILMLRGWVRISVYSSSSVSLIQLAWLWLLNQLGNQTVLGAALLKH